LLDSAVPIPGTTLRYWLSVTGLLCLGLLCIAAPIALFVWLFARVMWNAGRVLRRGRTQLGEHMAPTTRFIPSRRKRVSVMI
jgi:hypothetical protein